MSASVASKSLAVHQSTSIVPAVEASSMKRELRVLQVFSVLSVGGAETWLMSLLKYFREAEGSLPVRVKCDILLTGGEPSVFDEEAKALGARLFYVPFTRRNTAGFIREFRRILVAGNYDVIHDHQDYIAGLHFAMGLGRLPRIRIAHVHSAIRHRSQYANDRVRAISISSGRRILKRLATHILGTSRQAIDEYGFRAPTFRGVGVVNCGFDASKFAGDYRSAHAEVCHEFGWDESAKIILFVGRLDGEEVTLNGRVMSQKNPDFALEVFRESFARDETVQLLMVGSGQEKRKRLKAKVNDWGVAQRVRFLSGRADVARLMLGSDLLLFPSLAEGLGMVVVEAQAAGLRVLASDTTPRECVVIPGLVKFLSLDLKPRDWADEVRRLLNLGQANPSECIDAITRSPFSIENSAASLLEIYRSDQ
jgi:glycosyltransferase involved in cell wall biosynthesis